MSQWLNPGFYVVEPSDYTVIAGPLHSAKDCQAACGGAPTVAVLQVTGNGLLWGPNKVIATDVPDVPIFNSGIPRLTELAGNDFHAQNINAAIDKANAEFVPDAEPAVDDAGN